MCEACDALLAARQAAMRLRQTQKKLAPKPAIVIDSQVLLRFLPPIREQVQVRRRRGRPSHPGFTNQS